MTRDAELRARDFVALVSGGVHAETEVGVAAAAAAAGPDGAGLLCRAGLGARRRLAAIRRPATGIGARRRARIGPPAGLRQHAVRSVLSTRHVGTLADLLDHDPAESGLAGLEIDTDLRWRIVTALATAGDIDADGPATPFIDAEVQRDPTAAGKRHGAQAAAARPQQQVKEEAWTTVVEDDTAGQHHRPRRSSGALRSARPERAAPAVHRPLFRGHRRGLGAAIQRGRPDGGDRAVPLVGHQRRRHCRRRQVPEGPDVRSAAGITPTGARRPSRSEAVVAGAPVRRW